MAQPKDVVGAALVVGGGIAGVQASLDLAESGYKGRGWCGKTSPRVKSPDRTILPVNAKQAHQAGKARARGDTTLHQITLDLGDCFDEPVKMNKPGKPVPAQRYSPGVRWNNLYSKYLAECSVDRPAYSAHGPSLYVIKVSTG